MTKISEPNIYRAKTTDPTNYLQAKKFLVRRSNRTLYVYAPGDNPKKDGETYRITRKDDGRWLHCDKYGRNGGDNIKLILDIEPGIKFQEAVARLIGEPAPAGEKTESVLPPPPQIEIRYPCLPLSGAPERAAGREYLASRGISPATMDWAEEARMLRYCNGAVLFIGHDPKGRIRSATRRAIHAADQAQKRDFLNSDKSYPSILPGDPAWVYIVEGGVDALAVADMVMRQGGKPPTIIISGGSGCRSFLWRDHVRKIMAGATLIVVACEIEETPETQARTDAEHTKQAEVIAKIAPDAAIKFWKPRQGEGKDLADANIHQIAQEANKKAKKTLHINM